MAQHESKRRWLAGLCWMYLAPLVATCALPGCLPNDERPEPGTLLVNVKRSEAAVSGFTTDDGWTVSFTRFNTAVGNMSLQPADTGACSPYSDSTYDRLFDFSVSGDAKVALHFGLGTCAYGYSAGVPSPFALVTEGTTVAERELMAPPAGGLFEEDDDGPPGLTDGASIGLWLDGTATNGSVSKSFSWKFRTTYYVDRCSAGGSDNISNTVLLTAGVQQVRNLEVRPQELFRVVTSTSNSIDFGRVAAADVNGDGEITLDELRITPISDDELAQLLGIDLRVLPILELLPEANVASAIESFHATDVVVPEGADNCSLPGFGPGF